MKVVVIRTYHETSKNKGISISGANFISQPTINGVNVKGNIDSTYKSVTDQSGIHAGNDGVNITVGNTTTLKGAIITSKATPEKNKLSTKSLVMEDLHNEASYKAKKSGIAMNTSGLTAKGILGKINPLGLSPVVSIPVSDEAQSTTKSAISDTILVEVEGKPLTTINRDTEDALNSIKPIFDKADVKERMEYVNAVSDEGFKLIGDIAMKQVQKYEEKVANTSDEALKKRYQKEADKWKDGGIYKVALHGGFGAVVSNMAGGSSLDGFATASANEIMVGAIAKELAKHPNSTINADGKYVDNSDVYKIASAVLGKTVSHSSLGTGISLSATQKNYLTHEQNQLRLSQLAAAKTAKEYNDINSYWQNIDEAQESELKNKIEDTYYMNPSDRYNPNIYFSVEDRIRENKEAIGAVNPNYEFKSIYGFDGKIKERITIHIVGRIEDLYNGRYDSDIFRMLRFKLQNQVARRLALLKGYSPDSVAYRQDVLKTFNEIDAKGNSIVYNGKSFGYGLTDAVIDNNTFDLSTHVRTGLNLNRPNNNYYYAGRMTGDAITTVEGAGLVVTGLGETGLTIAGAAPSSGASLALTPTAVGQIAAGGGVIANSGKNFGNDITLFAKAQKQQTSGIIQKDHMDIDPIRNRVSESQFRNMDLGIPMEKHYKQHFSEKDVTKVPVKAEPNSSVDIYQNGNLKQRRYYDNEGNPIVDIDYTHSGNNHDFPHKHVWLENLGRSKHK